MAAFGAVALTVATVAAQQTPPPTVPPPTPPTTTPPTTSQPTTSPVGPARGVGLNPAGTPLRSTSAVIVGQVVDSSGRGVPNTAVRLIAESVVETVLTDSKGRFFFKSIPPGEAIVTAQKFGYLDGAFGKRRAGGQPLSFTLSTGQFISDMRIEVFRSAVITGMVVDDGGEPIIGARVVALRRKFVEGQWQYAAVENELTDDEGFYRIFGLPPGEYIVSTPATSYSAPVKMLESIGTSGSSPGGGIAALLIGGAPETGSSGKAASIVERARVTSDGRDMVWTNSAAPPDDDGRSGVYSSQFYPATGYQILALPMTLAPGDVRYGVNFHLPLVSAKRVSGRLIGEDGTYANQLVRLIPEGSDAAATDAAATVSQPDGTFSFRRVPAGRYRLEAGNLGAMIWNALPVRPGEEATAPPTFWGRTDVSVSDEDVATPDVLMLPTVTVSGHIELERPSPSPVGDPAFERIAISISPAGLALPAGAAVRPETSGDFAANNVVPGNYFVRVGTLPQGWFLKSVTAGVQDGMDAAIEVAADGLSSIVVTLTTAGTSISGSVRDARMQAVAGATVIILPVNPGGAAVWTPNRTRETRTSSYGVFTVAGLSPGEYLAVAIDDAVAEGWQDPAMIAVLRTQATRLTLRDGEAKTVQLKMSTGIRR